MSQFQPNTNDSRQGRMQRLRRELGGWEARPAEEDLAFSSGLPAFDRLLPGGALRYGMLVEWFARQEAAGAGTLSLLAAREAARAGGGVVVLDRRRTFYPPAAAAWGVDLRRVVVVQPASPRDELWAAIQALRSPIVAAVWGAIEQLDGRGFRQLQLAAQEGRTLGLLLRPAVARGQPSWADVQLAVEAVPPAASDAGAELRQVGVRVLRCRGARPRALSEARAVLEIDDGKHVVREGRGASHDAIRLPVVTELAPAAAVALSARA